MYAKVYDAFKASYGIESPEQAVNVLAQSAMRKEVGNLELDQLVSVPSREAAIPTPSLLPERNDSYI